MQKRALTLVIPGLLGPWPKPAHTAPSVNRLPALEKLLSRAQQAPVSGPTGPLKSTVGPNYETLLCHLFGLPADAELPLAALTRLVDCGQPETGFWLRADPVFLQADMYRLVLHPAPTLSQDEADRLGAAINHNFAGSGIRLETPQPARWYLHCQKPPSPALRTTPLSTALGQDITSLLPSGPDARRWHALLTECQMLLHNHPCNRVRESQGLPLVNSIWLWGGGNLPASTPNPPYAELFGSDILLRGLARWTGSALNPLPDNGQEYLELSAGNGLIVLTDLLPAVQNQDQQQWYALLQAIEQNWFATLLAALRRQQLETLNILACDGRQFTVRRAGLRHFWRKANALNHWL